MANGFSQGIALGQAFKQGRQRKREEQLLNALAPMVGSGNGLIGSQEFLELSQINPDAAARLKGVSDMRTKALFDDARVVNSFLKSGQPEQAMNILSNRLGLIEQLGGDPSDTMEVANFIAQGDLQGARNLLDSVEQAGVAGGFLKDLRQDPNQKVTANIADYLFHQELVKQGKQDQADAFANKAGLSKLNPEETAALQVETERLKTQDKEKAKRLGGYVANGVGAADSVGNFRRALSLLDSVKTGGFDNAALRVKQFFGVEGADEGELSNNLGKAVLSQLRSTFGAAFTAKEGEQLQRIESGFGKSTATNKRLLKNALKVAERAARRGIRAAKELGSDFEAEEITLALDSALGEEFDFSTPIQAAPTQPVNTGGFRIISVSDQ